MAYSLITTANGNTDKFSKRLVRWFKPRFIMNYLMGLYAVLFATATDASIRHGLGIVVVGLLLRGCANGYAIKTEELTVSGPYAYTRNPLYVGSFLIMFGMLIILQIPVLMSLMFTLLFVLLVFKETVRKEERLLLEKFGAKYKDYKRNVPAFLPTAIPYRNGDRWGWSLKRYLVSQEYKIAIWTLVFVIFFHLKNEIFVEEELMTLNNILLFASALVLAILDGIGEVFRKSEWACLKRDGDQ